MQSRCFLQAVLALSSLILSKTKHVLGSGSSCVTWSPADDGHTRVTFLEEDAAGARSLYTSLWSEDERPLTCEVNSDPLVTERYRTSCDRSGTQDEDITKRFNISMLLAPDAPCALASSSERTRGGDTEGKVRRKRAWIFPGTLWCGTGSRAVRYDQLGMFENADKCCREHDHCVHVILAFTVNYGVFNPNFYTVSHCDCDKRFRQCLLSVNDTIANMVGYSFFNIMQVPCFELKVQRRCTEMYWWGKCKELNKAPYAIFKKPLPYNSSDDASKYGDNSMLNQSEGQHVSDGIIKPHRKSPKSEHRCSKDPTKEDTLNPKRTKGKGCKRRRKLYTVAPSPMPPMSSAHSTTLSTQTDLLTVSTSSTLVPNKHRNGKKNSIRKGLFAYPKQGSQVSTTSAYPQTSTAHSTPPVTETTLQLHLSTTSIAQVTKNRKKVPKKSGCCGSVTPLRGDTFQPHCNNCREHNTTSHTTTATPSTTTYRLPIKVMTAARTLKTTETHKQVTLKTLWSTTTSATPVTTKLRMSTFIHEDGKPQQQMESPLLQNDTNQEPVVGAAVQSTHADRGLKQNFALHNMTDNQLLCGSLKHLDNCRHKISPLEKKYDLQNTDSKTAYHCDCTSRLAVQIESFKQPTIVPKLLMDFVSPYCFKVPKGKNCQRRKSCSGGFTKASDLLQALKMIEEKGIAGVRNSGYHRRRGIPVRLYKRCLRLEREADIMAQLT